MKGTCTLVASALAASTVALTTTCHHHHAPYPSSHDSWISSSSLSSSVSVQSDVPGSHTSSSNREKFAPRFDGLRFIETLVTAHR